jgi:Ca-activated chloride channel homolog
MFDGISFAYPWVLYFLIIPPLLGLWYYFSGKKREPSVTFSSLNLLNNVPGNWREKLHGFPVILRLAALGLLIIALARPQSFSSSELIYSEGIDIAVVLDVSGSMLAEDFKPNRLEAAKIVTDNFIEARLTDRIGLVIFAREAFTQCPLTVDYTVLRNSLREVKSGVIEDATAIGNAIANGVNRLKDSEAKSKILILLTDGINNAGEVDPISASKIAAAFGVRVYTIGVGTRGQAPYPINTPFGTRYQMVPVEIDEEILKEIAANTNGKYYRAIDNRSLQSIYEEIDKLEKTRIEVSSYRNAKELFYGWLGAGFLLLFLEAGLARTIFRKLP